MSQNVAVTYKCTHALTRTYICTGKSIQTKQKNEEVLIEEGLWEKTVVTKHDDLIYKMFEYNNWIQFKNIKTKETSKSLWSSENLVKVAIEFQILSEKKDC